MVIINQFSLVITMTLKNIWKGINSKRFRRNAISITKTATILTTGLIVVGLFLAPAASTIGLTFLDYLRGYGQGLSSSEATQNAFSTAPSFFKNMISHPSSYIAMGIVLGLHYCVKYKNRKRKKTGPSVDLRKYCRNETQ